MALACQAEAHMGVQRSKAASRHTHPANTLPGAIGGWSEPRIWMKRSIPHGKAAHKGQGGKPPGRAFAPNWYLNLWWVSCIVSVRHRTLLLWLTTICFS